MTIGKKYCENTQGNVAVISVIATVPLLLGIGVVLDYSFVSERRQSLQTMNDAAVLAASMSGEKKVKQLALVAEMVANANNVSGIDFEIDVKLEKKDVIVNLSAEYEPLFGSILRMKNVPYSTSAVSPLPSSVPINLALVLDSTLSMKGDNLEALQDATESLLDQLEDEESETRVSIVPFGQYVNIGEEKVEKDTRKWIDRGNEGVKTTSCYYKWKEIVKPTCVKVGKETYPVYDVEGNFVKYRTRDKKKCSGGKWEKEKKQTCKTKAPKWNGCMGTRTSFNKAREAAVGVTKLPAALDVKCGEELLPLSTDFKEMRKTVKKLKASGTTYIPGGLVWGWRTLNPELPYQQASSSDSGSHNAMLFMTDGDNVVSRGDGSSNTSGVRHNYRKDSGAGGEALARDLCKEIKKDGIQIYVVAYKIPGAKKSDPILKNCASSPANFFEPESSKELLDVFNAIAGDLNRTRLKA